MDNIEIYKKWRKNSSGAGFASFYNWTFADRVAIEIADTDPNSNKIISISKCYVPTIKMLAYLHAEVHGTISLTYPTLRVDDKYKHGITFFGGSKDRARVFKIEDWAFDSMNGGFKGEPGNVRRFKAGEFGVKAGSQAVEPDYSSPFSRNSIQMKPEELAELYQHLLLTQQAYETAWMASGMTRKEFNAKVEADGNKRKEQGIYD